MRRNDPLPDSHEALQVPLKPVLLNVEQVAALLNLSVRSVWRLRSTKQLPRDAEVRLGGSVRWKRSSILDWVEAGCPRSTMAAELAPGGTHGTMSHRGRA